MFCSVISSVLLCFNWFYCCSFGSVRFCSFDSVQLGSVLFVRFCSVRFGSVRLDWIRLG